MHFQFFKWRKRKQLNETERERDVSGFLLFACWCAFSSMEMNTNAKNNALTKVDSVPPSKRCCFCCCLLLTHLANSVMFFLIFALSSIIKFYGFQQKIESHKSLLHGSVATTNRILGYTDCCRALCFRCAKNQHYDHFKLYCPWYWATKSDYSRWIKIKKTSGKQQASPSTQIDRFSLNPSEMSANNGTSVKLACDHD